MKDARGRGMKQEKTLMTPDEMLIKARSNKLDIDTEGGILCVNCFESNWYRGEYQGYKILGLIPFSDACYNCHEDSK